MATRKQLIEEIMASFHAMKNKMITKMVHTGHAGGITHSQLFVLAIIEQHHHIGIKEIAKKLHISSSAATQLVDGLVKKSYVVRHTDAHDRRALHLELSGKGKTHVTELKKKRMKMMARLFDALNDKELAMYSKLHKIILSKLMK